MRAERECPQCHAPVTRDAPDGFCPACMLEGALRFDQPHTESPATTGAAFDLPRLGDYQLLDELSRGGMGVVYRARQLSLNRIVAIKMILLGQFADESSIRRFQAEAAAVAKLRHPNIVSIHEVGTQSGQRFFSMEFIDGQNLADFIRTRALTINDAAQLLKTIAEAVHYAHQQGIVHRDLKPSNILIDCFHAPHITDFGLARDLQSDSDLTITGQVLGSPNYISPEQATGQPANIASDIYALGAILYHLLTGRPPFTADTLTSTLQQVTNNDPIAPRLLNPTIPRDLETICLKCLQKNPSHRYSTAADLAAELKRFLRHEPIHARPISAPAKAWRWCRRKPVVATLTAAVFISILVGFAGVTWQWRRAEQKAEESRRNLYAADMIRAQNAIQLGSIGLAQELARKYLPRRGEKDLRGWEWRFVWNQCRGDESFSLELSDSPVFKAIRPSIGGNLITASGSRITFWDLKTKQPLRHLDHTASVTDFECLSGEINLVSSMSNGSIALWDLQTSFPTILLSNLNSIRAVSLSPNQKFLAIYAPPSVTLWNFAERRLIRRFPVSGRVPNQPCGLAFSPDSSALAYGLPNGDIARWDLINDRALAPFKGHQNHVHSLAYSRNGASLASGSRDQSVCIWDSFTGKQLCKLTNFVGFVLTVSFDPSSAFLAAAGAGQEIQLFETQSWRQINSFKGHSDTVRFVTFSPDGESLITASRDGFVKMWPVTTNSQPHSQELSTAIQSTKLLQNGALCVTYTNRNHGYWKTEPLSEASTFDPPMKGVIRSGVSPDGQLWLAESSDAVHLFTASRQLITNIPLRARLPGQTPGIERDRFEFSADSRQLAVLNNDFTCDLFSITTNQTSAPLVTRSAVFQLKSKSKRLWSIHLPVDAPLLALGYEQGITEIWNTRSAKKIATLSEVNDSWPVADIAISRDGSKALIASAGGKVRLWDIHSARLLATFRGQLGSTSAVAFSPDESRIAATGGDGAVRIWDHQTSAEVATIKLHDDALHQLAFIPETDTLIAVGNGRYGGARLFTLRAPKYRDKTF